MQSIVTQCFEKHGQTYLNMKPSGKEISVSRAEKKMTVAFSLSGNFFLLCGHLVQHTLIIHKFHKTFRMWTFHIIHVVVKCKAWETRSAAFAGQLNCVDTLSFYPSICSWKNAIEIVFISFRLLWRSNELICVKCLAQSLEQYTQYILTMIIIMFYLIFQL